MSRTVLMIEPHLEGCFGHPWRYANALSRRFTTLGWSMRILAHAAYRGPQRIVGAEVTPQFARSYYERRDRRAASASPDPSCETSTLSPFASTVLHAIETEADRSTELRVLVPTATVAILAELLALPMLLTRQPRMALLFHEKPELYASWYRPLDLATLRSRLRGSGWGTQIRCFATNRRLAQRLEELLGIAVDTIGDIFDEDEIARLTVADDGDDRPPLASDDQQLIDALDRFKRDGGRLAWCPGRMRLDKGAAQLPVIVGALARAEPRYRLLLQRPDIGDGALPIVNEVARSADVQVLSDDLSDAAYHALLRQADVILLPYDPDAYGWRVSRVYLEAALAGTPVLAAAGMSAETEAPASAAMFIKDWRSWPDQAAALSRRRRREADDTARQTVTQWHRLTAWLTESATPDMTPHKPVLHIRSFDPTVASGRTDDRRFAHLATRGFAMVELMIPDRELDRRTIRAIIQDQRASSLAQLTAWPQPRTRLVRRLRRIFGIVPSLRKVLSAFERPGTVLPAVIELIRLRRGFAFVLLDHADQDAIVAPVLADTPRWIAPPDTGGRPQNESDFASDMDAALARLLQASNR